MKLIEAITKIDHLKHNTFGKEEKIAWLSTLDGMVKRQIIDTHEGADAEKAIAAYIRNNRKFYEASVIEYMKLHEVSREEAEKNVAFREIKYKEAKEHIAATRNDIFFTGYDADTPGDTELLVPAPYDELYLWWLSAQIDYHNAELAKYNNSIALFNTGYSVYAELYNREHMPLGAKCRFF